MSIFDDIGKGFKEAGSAVGGLVTGDTYFPDNSSREARARELSGDVSQISYRIASDNDNIKTGLKDLNATIESVYRDAQAWNLLQSRFLVALIIIRRSIRSAN